MRTCYYKILGVSALASQEEIKKAFRMLAMRFHPDRNPGDVGAAERFKEALEAYETLADHGKRCRYDKVSGNGGRGGNGRLRKERKKSSVERFYEVILEGAFGIQNECVSARRSCELRFDLQIHADAALVGTFEQIDYKRSVFCGVCCGNGRRLPSRSCGKCNGKGEIEEACSIRVWVPARSIDGSRFRIAGGGDHPIPGKPAGDLIVLLFVIDGKAVP
jgi:molecular chaperone DnaJ